MEGYRASVEQPRDRLLTGVALPGGVWFQCISLEISGSRSMSRSMSIYTYICVPFGTPWPSTGDCLLNIPDTIFGKALRLYQVQSDVPWCSFASPSLQANRVVVSCHLFLFSMQSGSSMLILLNFAYIITELQWITPVNELDNS